MSVLLEALSVTADAPVDEFPYLQLENGYAFIWRASGLGYWQPHAYGSIEAIVSGSFEAVEGAIPATAIIAHDAAANTVTWTLDDVDVLVCEVAHGRNGFTQAAVNNIHWSFRWRSAWARTAAGDERTWDWHDIQDMMDWRWATGKSAPALICGYTDGILECYLRGLAGSGHPCWGVLYIDRLSLHGGRLLNAAVGRPLWLHRSDRDALVEETLS